MYHSEVRCIYNKLNPLYICVPQWSTLHLQQTEPFVHLCTTVKYVAFTTNLTLCTSVYHSEVRCIYNKLNPLYICVPQWSTLHLQQTEPFVHLCTTVKYVAFTTNLTLCTSVYHSEVRCIYNKLNPLYICVPQWSTLHLQQTEPFVHLCTTVKYVAFTTNWTLCTSVYHSEVRCIYNKLNPLYICVPQWSTLHLQQTEPFVHLCTTVKYVAFTTNLTLCTSVYHSEVRCIYNKLNPLYICVPQWSTLHLQQT